MKYSRGQLSSMAKTICKANDALHNAIAWCEEISHDNDICDLLNNKEEYQEEYKILIMGITKYANRLDSADAKLYGLDLDDATELFELAYEDIGN